MCAIIGEVNCEHNSVWIDENIALALQRGKDLVQFSTDELNLYHTRLATNDSKDVYPIELDGTFFAMNGIVSAKMYKELQTFFEDEVEDYTVDSAYLLRLILDNYSWKLLDSDDFVFAFWLVDNRKLFLANKDFPLFIKQEGEGLRFSSFKNDFEPLGNKVIEYDLDTKEYKELYQFTDLVYG